MLIEPPFSRLFKGTYSLDRYPLALGYLSAAVAEGTQWDVSAYNADFSSQAEPLSYSYLTGPGFENYRKALADPSAPVWGEVRRAIAEYGPAAVGISAKSQTFASACRVARLAKEVNRRSLVIVGGPHPSMVGSEALKCPDIDVAAVGEGERTIVELLRAIETSGDLEAVPGIAFRRGERAALTPLRPFIEDLDSLPFPHAYAPRVLRDYDRYPVTAFKYVFATRGCPFRCTFCGSHKIWSRRVRFRSPGNVAAEVQGLQGRGLRFVHFDDDTFGVSRQYIGELCEALSSRCPGLKWSCELHVKLVEEGTISLMKSAGCYSVQLGIESGSNEILREIRKNCTIEEALSAAAIIKKAGLELSVFFMVGFPQETEQTLKDTLRAMERISCDTVIYSIFTPYPGTEAFDLCRQNGLIGDDFDVSLYNHHSPANCFCIRLAPERFREMVSRAERMADRRNKWNRLRRLLSWRTLGRVRELGIRRGLRKGIRTFLGR